MWKFCKIHASESTDKVSLSYGHMLRSFTYCCRGDGDGTSPWEQQSWVVAQTPFGLQSYSINSVVLYKEKLANLCLLLFG